MKKIWWWLMSSQVVKALLALGIITLLLVGTFAYGNSQNKLAKENSSNIQNIDLDLQPDTGNNNSASDNSGQNNVSQDDSQKNSSESASNNYDEPANTIDEGTSSESRADDENGQIASGVTDSKNTTNDQQSEDTNGKSPLSANENNMPTDESISNNSNIEIPATGTNPRYYFILSLLSVLLLTNYKLKRQINF